MASNQNQFGSGFDQAALAMSSYFRQQPRYEILGTVFAIFWVLGGLFADKSLYLISMLGSTILFVGVLLTSLIPSKKLMSYAHSASFRRLFTAIIARWGYTTGRSKGAKDMTLLDNTININDIADLILLFLFVTWIITKYGEQIDTEGIFNRNAPVLFIRGVFRGMILFAALWSMITDDFPENFQFYLFISYLIEPYVYYIYAKLNPSLSSTDMVLGNSRLPMVALRESFFTNLLLLIITMVFNGVTGDEWGLLRVYYLVGSAFIFYTSYEEIKNYKLNPFGKGVLADFLTNTPVDLQNVDLDSALGMIIDKETQINLGDSLKYNLQPGSILVPMKETKNQVTTLVLGKAEMLTKSGIHNLSEVTDGITTLVIPKKQINSITNNLSSKRLSDMNFKELSLPTLVEIQSLLGIFSSKMSNWVQNLRNELTKFDLSNYGITNIDGVETVKLPGISVITTPDGESVKVGPVRVLDTALTNTVRVGNWLTVVDFPKFNMVSLPGIKILDVQGVGSALNIFGFKISDNLSADYIEEFEKGFATYLDQLEERFDSRLGKILANQKSNISLNMSWEGELKPLLADKKDILTDQLLLEGTIESSRQLSAGTSVRGELLMLTGMSDKDGYEISKSKSSSDGVKMPRIKDIKRIDGLKAINIKDERKLRKAQHKQGKLDKKLNRVQEKIDRKLDTIQESLDSVKNGISEKSDSHEFDEIIDVDYEIVDEDEP
ncbi:MAG: hypothetical protein GPJ54_14185 [Candidatus Heimdallarchaeota archaeon]|nr:hypothetical protein [Candidatus Heimdallarchaeota archaeon]